MFVSRNILKGNKYAYFIRANRKVCSNDALEILYKLI